MNLFLLNVLLALLWAAISGTITLASLITGFALGALVLAVAGRALGQPRYLLRLWRALALIGVFLFELLRSSVQVAWDVLTPRHRMRPSVISVPLDLESDAAIALLANLVSLTPGTLSVDVAHDRGCLYVHAMYADDPDAVRAAIKRDFERRVREVFE